ncbi:hypothetical protein AGIG_G1199 [Arapaima gigas]
MKSDTLLRFPIPLPRLSLRSSALAQSAASHVTSLTEHARTPLCCQAKIRQQKDRRSAIDKHADTQEESGIAENPPLTKESITASASVPQGGVARETSV